ncbi:helicase-exonuclease AddAB subunit AddA [Streptococcus iniae]|uniref:helicase-exonuclease AddAB subunit AddA n=1 Tax=Streptococcus iniae TaxID=1346 RepID=UPI000EFAC4D0|nr:helicase-exonuclease AddAB subunit AddA [Streptococcus iniae]RMI76622.1 helicase-exonuclease AddAB subunit AddA [Streptococcus iniae]
MNFEPFLDAKAIIALQEAEMASDKVQKRTAEQIEAIYSHGQNILVSASAGSGKTFVMVERIIDKIMRGVAIDRMFISTFTVKAATELKERLEKKLIEAIKSQHNPDVKHYLSEQLHHLDQADIGTMDAFTQKLVSQYGYSLGISPKYRIMQEKSEQDILKTEVFDKLFESYMQKHQGIFIALVQNFSGKAKTANSFKQLVYQIHQFCQSTDNPKKWLAQNFLKGVHHYQGFADYPKEELELFLECMQKTAAALQDITDLEDYKQVTAKGSETKAYQKHKQMIASLYEFSTHFETMYGFAKISQLAQDLTALLPSGQSVTVAGQKYPVFKDLQNHLEGLRHLDIIFQYQGESLPLLELLQAFIADFSEAYLQAKMAENAFEFSDIAHFAISILEGNEAVRLAYQEHYHEVMVDEYQDNNHMQERLLELLSTGQNRFMVGDIKQSIYRFRQADPQIFNAKFKDYQENPQHGQLIILKENFRSQSEVLDVTNAIFTHLMDEAVGDILYDGNHQLLAGSDRQKEEHPENKCQFLIYNTDLADDSDESTTLEESESDGISPWQVKLLVKEIIKLHTEEGVPFSDITLLVSSRTRNDTIFQAFNHYGIPLVADGGQTNYLKSVEVMLMLDTLRTINNPLNDYALVALMRSLMFGFDEDQLARIALQGSNSGKIDSFYEKLCNCLKGEGEHPELISSDFKMELEQFHNTLDSWRHFAKSHSLYDLIWKIFNDRFYYDLVATSPKAEQAQANLYALALRSSQFEKTGFKGLSRFIRMIDKILETQNDLVDVEIDQPKNAVNLMTIHKSKGLEFKYVFILNCDKRFSMTDLHSPLILDREMGIGIKYIADVKEQVEAQHLNSLKVSLETLPFQLNKNRLKRATLSEQMRLLYVAMTRAKKKLYLIGKGSQQKAQDAFSGQRTGNHLSQELRESLTTFQDWILAISENFKEDLHFDLVYVSDKDLTANQIGRLSKESFLNQKDNQKDNRQTLEIARAIDMLDKVSELNQLYDAAIHLPTVRTPSQLKKYYEPLMDNDGVDVIDKQTYSQKTYKLPNFSKSKVVESSQIGSALHELMQRITVSDKVSMREIKDALALVSADDSVKEKIDLKKILAFFQETDLGQKIQAKRAFLHREAPFAMLKKDPKSQEKFVVRGIIDGYLLFDDRIVLFDYKTDRYSTSLDMVNRYSMQMELYAQALKQAYRINKIEKYLVLMGGQTIEVVAVD